MSGLQRIHVVSAAASEADVARVRAAAGRDAVVLAAPTPEAKRVVGTLGSAPTVELALAPVSYPQADRGHALDALVRSHALHDRFRDVVVVTDQATATLLLRVLAPDQLAAGGAVTVVGLPRGDRPVDFLRASITGVVAGVAAAVLASVASILVVPGVLALAGLVLLLVPSRRHVGRELLLAGAISVVVVLMVVAGSARFPGGW